MSNSDSTGDSFRQQAVQKSEAGFPVSQILSVPKVSVQTMWL